VSRRTIGDALRWLAERDPAAPAVRDEVEALDRSELVERAAHYAGVLRDLGVRPDALVSIRLPNTVEFVVATVAVWLVGATPQPLSGRLGLDEQRAIVEVADSAVVLGADAADFPGRRTVPAGVALAGVAPWAGPDLAASSWKAPTSSGSTGRPKIVLAAADATIDPESTVAPFVPRAAVQLVCAPLTHSAPFTYAMRGLMTGHSLVLLPRFEPAAVLDAIARHRITWVMLVPTMLHRMLRLPVSVRQTADLSSLESILHIGARCSPDVKHGWIDWIGADRVVEVYAGSESAGLTMIVGHEWLAHPGSVGRPVSGSRMRVVSPEGEEVPPGTVGLVQMRRDGPPTYRYLGAEERIVDGWHTLGDLGRMDADGYLWIEDRADDLIVTGGEKLAPAIVEAAAEAHPAVRSAVAVGIPDVDLGEAVGLVVDIDGDAPTGSALAAWIVDRAGAAARPARILVVHEPLRDDAGKVRRSHWRAAFG
jgi:bile acid-coenzyme A ligase